MRDLLNSLASNPGLLNCFLADKRLRKRVFDDQQFAERLLEEPRMLRRLLKDARLLDLMLADENFLRSLDEWRLKKKKPELRSPVNPRRSPMVSIPLRRRSPFDQRALGSSEHGDTCESRRPLHKDWGSRPSFDDRSPYCARAGSPLSSLFGEDDRFERSPSQGRRARTPLYRRHWYGDEREPRLRGTNISSGDGMDRR